MMASKYGTVVLGSLLRSSRASPAFITAPLLRPYPRLPRTLQPAQVARRYAHQIPRPGRPEPPAGKDDETKSETKPRKLQEPHYELTFTCVPCGTRSTHAISKQGYHKGSVLITCPSCRNRHIISDHLNIFGDRKLTIEDLMKERGQLVKRGTLGVDGDIEFWEDGTQTERGASSTVATDTRVADESNGASNDQELSTPQRIRDPLSSSESPTTAPTPSLSTTSSRPRLEEASTTNNTPSTRRPFHTHTTSLSEASSDSKLSRSRMIELIELEEKMEAQNPRSEREGMGNTVQKEAGTNVTDELSPSFNNRSHFRKSPTEQLSFKKYRSATSEFPKSQLDMLRRSMSEIETTTREAPTSTTPDTSHATRDYGSLFKKIPIEATAGRPNFRNHEARKFMGFSEDNKFQTDHYEAASGLNTSTPHKQAPAQESLTHKPDTIPRRTSLATHIRKVQLNRDSSRKRTLYAWPEGATEAIEVRVDVRDKSQPQFPSSFRPAFRKLIPKQTKDKNAPVSSEDFMTEMFGTTLATPQRPLPEETYERITKGVESVRNLPQQKVHLVDFS